MKKLSVILINKNRIFSIDWCIRSILEQIGSDDELIVIDDSSDDGSEKVLESYSDRFTSFIRFSSGGNRSKVRNRAASEATGDVLVFVDGDVIIGPGTLECVRRVHEEDSVVGMNGMVYGNSHTVEQFELITNMAVADFNAMIAEDFSRLTDYPEIGDYRTVWPDIVKDEASNWMNYFTSFATASRSVFEEIGGFEEGFTRWGVEDMEFAYRLNPKGRIVVTDSITCYHHPHEKNAFLNALSNLENLYFMLRKYKSMQLEIMCGCTIQTGEDFLEMVRSMYAHIARYNTNVQKRELKNGEAMVYFPTEEHPNGYVEYMLDGELGSYEFFGLALPFVNGAFDRVYLSSAYSLLPSSFLAMVLQETLRIGKQLLVPRKLADGPAYYVKEFIAEYTFLFGEVCGIVHSMTWFDRKEHDEDFYEITWKEHAAVYLSKQIHNI